MVICPLVVLAYCNLPFQNEERERGPSHPEPECYCSGMLRAKKGGDPNQEYNFKNKKDKQTRTLAFFIIYDQPYDDAKERKERDERQ